MIAFALGPPFGSLRSNDVGIEDRIAIQDGITIGIRFRKRPSPLLHHPVGRRVSCDVEVQDPAPSMLDHEKAVQHSERRRRHGKQVQADDGFALIAKKRKPLLRRVAPRTIRRKYRATLLSETAKPSFWSSPWILEHPSRDFLVPGAGSGREFPP